MTRGVPLKDVVALVKEEEGGTATMASSVKNDQKTEAKSSPGKSKPHIRSQIGSFIASNAVQLLLSILLITVSFSSSCLAVLPIRTTYVTVTIVKGALRALFSFATTLFVLEIVAQIFVQGLRFFTHPGYMLDLIGIAATAYSQSVTSSPITLGHIQALSFLRYWRLAAVVIRMIASVETMHESTIANLLDSQADTKRLKAQLQLAEDRRSGDVQHRSEVEALCEAYKSEVDTLMAALQIAAIDVAKNGGGGKGVDVGGTEPALTE